MKVLTSRIPGLLRMIPTPVEDNRGFFARSFTAELGAQYGIPPIPDHEGMALNRLQYTLRGLHFQKAPWAEAKRVRCVRGAIWDVVVDLRQDSPTFLEWESFTLEDRNLEGLYLPPGLAHGYLTLTDDTLVEYAIYQPYRAEASAGIRWDDPRLAIRWPAVPAVIGKRDQELPFLDTFL